MDIKLKNIFTRTFFKKFFIMIVAIFFMGFFLSFLQIVQWGTDPFSFQNANISYRLRNSFGSFWSFGTFQLIINLVMLVFVLIFDYKLIGLGTIANMTIIGYVADFFRDIVWPNNFQLLFNICEQADLIWAKVIVFILALFGFVVAASVYMNTDMGVSPYDALSFIISHGIPKVPFAVTRICYDITGVLIGLLACIGSDIKFLSPLIGSLALSLTLGPMIQAVGGFMKKHVFKEETPAATEPDASAETEEQQ